MISTKDQFNKTAQLHNFWPVYYFHTIWKYYSHFECIPIDIQISLLTKYAAHKDNLKSLIDNPFMNGDFHKMVNFLQQNWILLQTSNNWKTQVKRLATAYPTVR